MNKIRENPWAALDAEGHVIIMTIDFTSHAIDRLNQLLDEHRTRMRPAKTMGCAVVTACFGDEQAPRSRSVKKMA